jgi:hypothetical protein
MTIASLDFSCQCAEAINMAASLMNRLSYIYLPSSTILFKDLYAERLKILYRNVFVSKCYIHMYEEEYSSRSQHLPSARVAIIVH